MSAEDGGVIEVGKDDMRNREEAGLTFTDEEIETIKNTVARKANESELKMFLSLCKRYRLDPFAKEIFFWKVNGRSTIMTSRDGYLKIADRHPQFDGLVSDVVREKDNFRRKSDGINHEYSTDRGEIIGAYALVYRKDRKYPIYVFAPFDEYRAEGRVWKQYPSAMILKVAESMALKRAFTVSGLVSREEMEASSSFISNEKEVDVISESREPAGNELTPREEEIKSLIGDNKELKKELFDYLSFIKERKELDKISLSDLSDDEYMELKNLLNQIKDMIDKIA